MHSQLNKVIAIVGPTATGKSDLAVETALYIKKNAKRLGLNGAAILSADSRQVYKLLDIGSGKITKKEMKGIPHSMLDIAHPSRTYTVAQFQKKAKIIIQKLHTQNILPILCGGTGMYVDSVLTDERYPEVKPNLKLRAHLEKLSTEKLFEQLQKEDPRRAQTVDKHNRRRLIRALEIIEHTHSPIQERRIMSSSFDTLIIGLTPGKDILQKRIAIRLQKRMKQGMIKEVKNLHDKHHISFKRLEALGLEYRYLAYFLQTKIDEKEMLEKLQSEIWKFSKRQMTWFKRNKDIIWISKPSLILIKNHLNSFLS